MDRDCLCHKRGDRDRDPDPQCRYPDTDQSPTQTSGTGSVAVSSNPSGAQVFMDNIYEGTTPLTISPVQPGTHSFLIKQAGYADWQVSEPVQSGQTAQIAATLSALPTPTEGAMPSTLVLMALGLLAFALISRRK